MLRILTVILLFQTADCFRALLSHALNRRKRASFLKPSGKTQTNRGERKFAVRRIGVECDYAFLVILHFSVCAAEQKKLLKIPE